MASGADDLDPRPGHRDRAARRRASRCAGRPRPGRWRGRCAVGRGTTDDDGRIRELLDGAARPRATIGSRSRSHEYRPQASSARSSLDFDVDDTEPLLPRAAAAGAVRDQLVPRQLTAAAAAAPDRARPPEAFAALVARSSRTRRGSSAVWPARGRSRRGTTLFARAEAIALAMPEDEQLELIDGAPAHRRAARVRLGAVVSRAGLRPRRGGAAAEAELRGSAALDRAQRRVRGALRVPVRASSSRPAAVGDLPLMEAALDADRDAELDRALRDVFAIARARAVAMGSMQPEEGDR